MTHTGVRCFAKINLILIVTGRRADGFHDIITLFQPVSLFDELRIELADSGIGLSGDDPSIPWDEDNLCHRAAASFIEAASFAGGVRIDVAKRIPHGAGLGGGSSDAAGVLLGMNELAGRPLGGEALAGLGRELGSDVPFFLGEGPCIGRGRGELLEVTRGLEWGALLIVKPSAAVSTRQAYDNVKIVLTRDEAEDRLNCLLKGLKDPPDRGLSTWNSFESFATREYPDIGEILDTLRNGRAVLSSLTGSGSACFALFHDREEAMGVEGALRGRGFSTYIVVPQRQALGLFQWE